jgi:hypothetical protein
VQLADGDVIELGRVRLKFETVRPESLPMESRLPVGIER